VIKEIVNENREEFKDISNDDSKIIKSIGNNSPVRPNNPEHSRKHDGRDFSNDSNDMRKVTFNIPHANEVSQESKSIPKVVNKTSDNSSIQPKDYDDNPNSAENENEDN
jgi:hypothetical protein